MRRSNIMLNLLQNSNPNQKDIDEWRPLGNGLVANKYAILCTPFVDYQLWVQTEDGHMPAPGAYSTITHTDEYGWMGAYTSVALPPELEALPGWRPGYWPEARIQAVQAWRVVLEMEAERLIKSAFPEDFPEDTYPTTGELETYYQECLPPYEMYKLIRVTGKPDKYHIIQNVIHSPFHFPSIISYTNVLPIFDTREDAIKALAIITVARGFEGMWNVIRNQRAAEFYKATYREFGIELSQEKEEAGHVD
jgi:hypothetical protein